MVIAKENTLGLVKKMDDLDNKTKNRIAKNGIPNEMNGLFNSTVLVMIFDLRYLNDKLFRFLSGPLQ